MKRGKRKWLVIAVKLLLVIAVYHILTKIGVNPFFSILMMLYWKTMVALGLLLGGIMYAAGIITF